MTTCAAASSIPVNTSIAEKWEIIRAAVPSFDQLISAAASAITCLESLRARVIEDNIMYMKISNAIVDEKGVSIGQYDYQIAPISRLSIYANDPEIKKMIGDYDITRELIVCALLIANDEPLVLFKIPYDEKSKLGIYVASKGVYMGIRREDIKIVRRKKCDNSGCRVIGGTKKCSQCKKVRYCSKECQHADWPIHKRVCKKDTVELD